jgi:dihydropteroate synthase
VLDPEMGFFSGATKYSFVVFRRISELHEFDLPVLPGTSRKLFFRRLWGHLKFTERDITCAAISSIDL